MNEYKEFLKHLDIKPSLMAQTLYNDDCLKILKSIKDKVLTLL